MSKFCPLPFSHLAIRPNGQVYPCCIFDWDYVPTDFNMDHADVFNHPFLEDVRNKMRSGELVEGCNKCHKQEEKTGESTRTFFLKHANDFGMPIEPTKNIKIKYLDLALSNTCNNKCRMCNPELSTSWYADAKALGIPIYKGILNQDVVLKDYDLSDLTFIKLIGGEPLMEQSKFIDVLKRCKRENLSVLLTTNATLTPNDELLALLKECKSCNINLSIDAYGSLNDFLRKGSRWEKTVETISWFNDHFKNSIKIHSVVSLYNVNDLHRFFYFIKDNYPAVDQQFVLVDGPDWMHPRHLPEYVKIKMKSLFNEWQREKSLPFLKLLEDEMSKPGDFRIFMKNDKKLSDLRKEHWKDVNPELFEMVKKYYE